MKRPALPLMLLILASIFLLFLLNLLLGSVHIPFGKIWELLWGTGAASNPDTMSNQEVIWSNILWKSRVPQALTALVAGAGLSVSGLQMQTVFRNPLAGPSVLGISSGASLGVACVVLLSGAMGGVALSRLGYMGEVALSVAAIIGALSVMALIVYVSQKVKGNVTLLIIGVMIGYVASAIIGGLKAHAGIDASEIIAADASEAAREKAKETLSICTTASNTEVSTQADVLFLSVKPQYYETVISEIQPTLPAGQIIVTIAPGKTLAWLGERLGDVKIVRTMPNTPALVGEGITGVCKNNLVTEDEFAYVLKLLSSFGLAEAIPESLMDAVVSVSGSSPAYVFLFIEAMADAAVADGMPRAQAYKFAAQAEVQRWF